jgi:hypothetical protein
MRQRGFTETMDLALVVGAVLLLVAMVSGALWYAGEQRDEGYASGQVAERAKWQGKVNADLVAARKKVEELEKLLAVQHDDWLSAEARAAGAAAELEESKHEAKRAGVALTACQEPRSNPGSPATVDGVAGSPPAGGAGQAGVADGGRDRAVFTWEFVREFDGGWTGLDGKPVSDLASGSGWAERAPTPSPYAAEDIIDVAGANASACSADRRKLSALIGRIRTAAATYEAPK